MEREDPLDLIKRLKAIADIGLLYNNNDYDKERYSEISQITFELLAQMTGKDIPALKYIYPDVKDYPTAKVDIRGMLIKDNSILFVKESADGKWSLPGGWADIGYSPKEVIIKEFKEETGLDVGPGRLLAVFDKKFHAHPPQPFYVYKMVFLCAALSYDIQKGFDVLDVQFFHIDNLPQLSEDRILKSQLELVFRKARAKGEDAWVD